MTLVIDASIAVKWLIDEPDHLAARSLLDRSEQLQAPDFVLIETANVLWKKVLRRELTEQQASGAIDSLPRLFEAIVPSNLLIARALRIAIAMSHPIYDCLYLACAERIDAGLVTADKRFATKARAGLSVARVHVLDELSSA